MSVKKIRLFCVDNLIRKFQTSIFGGDSYILAATVTDHDIFVESATATIWRKFSVEVDAMRHSGGAEVYEEVFIELNPTRKSLYFIALILAGEKKDSQRLRELYKSLVAADPRYSNLNVYFRIPDAENGDEEAIRELARARVLGPNMLVFIPGKASTDALYEIAAEKDNPFGERVEAAEALIRRKDPSIADVVVSDEFASGWRSDGSENSLNQWISALIGSTSDQEVVVDREQLLRWMKTIDAD